MLKPIIKKNGIIILKNGLNSPCAENREQAAWALGNIAGENVELRDMVLKESVMTLISQIIISNPEYSLLKSCTWCLCSLCKGDPQPDLVYVEPAISAILSIMGKDSHQSLLIDVSWALYYLVNETENRIPLILQSGLIPHLIRLLMHKEHRIALPCLRILGTVTIGTDEQVQLIIEANGLNALKALMESPNKSLRKESCWVLSNIASGPTAHVNEILKLGIVPILCTILINDDFEVKTEAVWGVWGDPHSETQELSSEQRLIFRPLFARSDLLARLNATPLTIHHALPLTRLSCFHNRWKPKS